MVYPAGSAAKTAGFRLNTGILVELSPARIISGLYGGVIRLAGKLQLKFSARIAGALRAAYTRMALAHSAPPFARFAGESCRIILFPDLSNETDL